MSSLLNFLEALSLCMIAAGVFSIHRLFLKLEKRVSDLETLVFVERSSQSNSER